MKSNFTIKLLLIILFWLQGYMSFTQEIIWHENFDDLADGTTVDNGSTSWSTKENSPKPGSFFGVRDGEFIAYKLHEQSEQKSKKFNLFSLWKSEPINISEKENIFVFIEGFSALADEDGVNFDPEDYIKFEYRINETGNFIPFNISGIADDPNIPAGTLNNDFVIAIASSGCGSEGLSGNTLEIQIKFSNSGSSETYSVDNIKVISDSNRPDHSNFSFVASGGGDWNSAATWGNSGIPTVNDSVLIDCNGLVEISGNAMAGNVTINGGGALIYNQNNAALSIKEDGNLLIRDGGLIRIGGAREVSSYRGTTLTMSGQSTIINNSAFNQAGTLNIHGSGSRISLAGSGAFELDSIFFNGPGQEFNNRSHLILNDCVDGSTDAYKLTNQNNGILEYAGPDLDQQNKLVLEADSPGNSIKYIRAGNQDLYPPDTEYHHLLIGGSGIKSTNHAHFDTIEDLVIAGDLTIRDAARLNLEGSMLRLSLAGNYNNSNTVTNGWPEWPGKLIFNGATDQSFYAGRGTDTINQVVIDKPTGSLILKSALRIESGVTFNSGLINSSSANLLIFADDAEAFSASTTSYVSGPVQKIGNDAFKFPLGAGGIFSPLGISAPNQATTSYTAQYFAEAHVATGNKNLELEEVSNLGYWDLDQAVNDDDVKVTLYWQDKAQSGLGNLSGVVVAHYNGTEWESMGKSAVTDANTGNITSNLVENYSPFTFASLAGFGPLPVVYQKFTGKLTGNYVQLEWVTFTEENNDYFLVEKSSNAENWEVCGKTEGHGNSMMAIAYTFTDPLPFENLTYYRLKQVDFDGRYEYSKIISVANPRILETLGMMVFPNPTDDYLEIINIAFPDQQIILRLNDTQGNSIFQQIIPAGAIHEKRRIDLTQLKPGLYFLNIQWGEQFEVRKVMVY